ncbi:MAG: NAD(P)-dependent oxidoreductase [Candidatus Omnitrophica bacterium]|nr:NAD(P)-dependent oxidoreductase [Candidatus Omnitrophota bacterium]
MRTRHKILLLGHTGFVGHALAAAFQNRGVEVEGVASHDMDLTQGESVDRLLPRVDGKTILVVAAAARPETDKGRGSAQANIEIAAHVARLIETASLEKCVYLSTASVYGEGGSDRPITEESPVSPHSEYAAAKCEGERLLQEATSRAYAPLVMVRPCRIFGAGDTQATYGPSRFVETIIHERHVQLYGDGNELRDGVFVRDAARAIVELSLGVHQGVFNLATGRSFSFREAVDCLRGIVPYGFEVIQKQRTGPLFNQHFDVTRLVRVLPGWPFTMLVDALKATYHESAEMATAGRPYA